MKTLSPLLALTLALCCANALATDRAADEVKGEDSNVVLPLGVGGVAIPDNLYRGGFGGATMACINVAGPGSGNVSNMTVTVPLTHTWVGDLVVKIAKVDGADLPTSQVVTLVSRAGAVETDDLGVGGAVGDSSNLLNTFPPVFKDSFTVSAESMGAAPLGTDGVICQPAPTGDGICNYLPNAGAATAGTLAAFNGLAATGNWRVCVGDRAASDTGSLFPPTIDFGVGGGGAGNLTITPTTVMFGNQNVGSTSAAMTVTLANTGTASLNVTALTAAAAPFARLGGTCATTLPITIANGANCTLTYTYSPTAAITSNQTLTVTANSPGSGTIALSGTGVAVAAGNLTITPPTITFANQAVGSTSAASTVTLANTGTASLQVTALTAATAPFARLGGTCATTLPITIANGANCTLTYTFAPTTATTSNQTLTVTANSPGSGTIALSGTGVAAPGVLGLSSAQLNFGNTAVGQVGNATLTLSNTGTGPLQVSAISAVTAPFSAVGGTCTAPTFTLAAGASCTLIYGFTPTAQLISTQTVTVTSNGGNLQFTLQGNGQVIATSIPSVSTIGQILLLVLLSGVAVVTLRRR